MSDGSIQAGHASLEHGIGSGVFQSSGGVEFRLYGGPVPRLITDPTRGDLLFRCRVAPICYGTSWFEAQPEGGTADRSGRWTYFRTVAVPEGAPLLQGGVADLMLFDAMGFATRTILAGMLLTDIRLVITY